MTSYSVILLVNFGSLLFLLFASSVTPSTCNFNVKLKQVLRNEGFHRNITYGIVFNSEDERESWLYKDCIVSLDQTLPAGVYANPDELGDLRRTHKLNAVPRNRINVELPAEQARASSVLVVGPVTDSRAYLWLPVHARYHQARAAGGTARNEIAPPQLYLRCPDQRLAACGAGAAAAARVAFLCNGSSKEKCSWKEIPYTMMTDTLIWDVPVGNIDHYYTVALGTGSVIAIGSLYLLKIIHEYTVKKKQH